MKLKEILKRNHSAVLKSMFKLFFSWIFFLLLGVCVYVDIITPGELQYLVSFLCLVLFWFYYEITSKDLELRKLNEK